MRQLNLPAVVCFVLFLSSFSNGQNTTDNSDNKLLCMADMVQKIETSCQQPEIQGHYVALENLLKQYLGNCFQTNFTEAEALHIMMPDLGDSVTAFLQTQFDAYQKDGGIEVVPTYVPSDQIVSEIEFELDHNLTNSHDGWITAPYGTSTLYNLDGFLDLRKYIAADSAIQWDDILPFVSQVSSVYNNQVIYLPLDGKVMLLYYRSDIFAAYNLSVPQTWSEMLDIAIQMQGVNLDGNNATTDYPVCFERRKACHLQSYEMMTIAASILQYDGLSQGLYFDPRLVGNANADSALINNAGMAEALKYYGQFLNLTIPSAVLEACESSLSKDWFASGRCLMAIGTGSYFKAVSATNASVIQGKLGVALAPGSPVVLDRGSGQLVPCTATSCPYSTEYTNATTTSYVNRCPFAATGGWMAAVNQRSDITNDSYTFLSGLSAPTTSWSLVTSPSFDFDPYRYQHFQNVQKWVSLGYNQHDTEQYLAAALSALQHPNIALDLRVPNEDSFRAIYESAAANLTLSGITNTSISVVMTMMDTQISKLLADPQNTDLSAFAKAYCISILFQLPSPPPPPPAPPMSPAPSGSPSWLPIAIVLPTVGALLLLAAAVVYQVRNNRKHKNLFGKVLPPPFGPDTAIVVTEIQDATATWETLPSEVMDNAIKEHHECMRRLLLKHSGYESSMEADTCILAFHSPKDALLFAMDSQLALLGVEWPQELLDMPAAQPVYVHGTPKEAKPKHLLDILDAGEAALAHATSSRFKSMNHETSNPTIPALVNVPVSETYTFAVACQRAWTMPSKEDVNARVLVFRGLRVRMGIHAGVHKEADVCYNRTDARTHYTGETVVMAKAVCESAHGGMVVISEETYKKLPLERLWDKYLVLHVGEHRLQETLPSCNLYHALNRALEGRLAYLGAVRSCEQLDPGVLDSPVGCVTIAFMNVVGAQTLLSWNADIAQQSLKIFHNVVGEELKKRRGYLVEAVDGLFLAAFQRPAEAILWALECNESMIQQEWPEDLLSHELCEELVISAPTKEGEVVNTVVFRGLRLKTGVDTGQVLGEVHAMTGRMTYRGKVMNRAARIASTASTGQVLCSADSWNLAATNDPAVLSSHKITGTSLGQFRLKGVAEKIEVYHCRKSSNVAPARRASSMIVMNDHWKWEQHLGQPIGPDDIILGPREARMMMQHNPFNGERTNSFDRPHSNSDLPQCAVVLSPEEMEEPDD